jgi:hypothetical protein
MLLPKIGYYASVRSCWELAISALSITCFGDAMKQISVETRAWSEVLRWLRISIGALLWLTSIWMI